MSFVKVILSNSLDFHEINNFCANANQIELNISNPDLYYAEFEKNKKLIKETGRYNTSNNFINAFLHAYNSHKIIRIRPDDIKLQLLMVISTFINNNVEHMKNFFVEHNEKNKLILKSTEFNAEYFCRKFSELLEQNIKCPEFAQHYKSKFSTSNRIIQTVNNITLMNTLKEYFSYNMILGCGIPGIILDGSQEDWTQLKLLYEYFKSITIDSELKDWYTHFDIIFNMFIELRMLQESGVIDEMSVPNNYKELFKRVISYIPQGSGDDQILGGWIRLFCPYSNSNKIIKGLDKSIQCLDITTSPPIQNNIDYYSWQNKMNLYYLGCEWNDISTSFITTPAKLIMDDGTVFEVEFYSGFFQPHLNESNEIMMNIGYILRENKEIKKEKIREYYLEKGVIGKEHGYLTVPKTLKPQIRTILDVFSAYSYCFYGIDAEQEEQKKQYFENGVEMVKIKFGYKYNVPEKFKNEKEKIMKAFEISERQIIFK
jgi:hypothetical protein